jgi:tRNA pseudouridine55 synthase
MIYILMKMPAMNIEKKTINGILLLNKSQGMTSNSALQKAKRLIQAKKAGHTGSLDPLATGMLPLCFGEATKICQYLLDADKCYETTGVLGVKTDSSDATGEITSQISNFSVSTAQLNTVIEQYKGKIKQVPSMFSALKHNGRALYHYARQGHTIERQAREVSINTLELKDFDGNNFSLRVLCSKGTYIRNLVEDIGDSLDVGAHVKQLHRVYTSGFEALPMYTLDELEQMSLQQRLDCLLPMDVAVNYLPSLDLSDDELLFLRQGRILNRGEMVSTLEHLRLYDSKKQFVGLGEHLSNGDIKAKRLLAFN